MSVSSQRLESKGRALHELLGGLRSALIAYSGGVDSAFLASAALAALEKEKVLAVIGRSPSYALAQREMALDVAASMGLPLMEIDTRELESPDYVANSGHRCFHCKNELYGRLARLARERGLAAVLDGTNADDADDHRPGMAAARALGVRSPLQEVGLTKAEIRTLARHAGLPNWDAPASPCLASRLAYGVEVTPQRLGQVERAEAGVRRLRAWSALRVRHHGRLARLELPAAELDSLADEELWRGVAETLRSAGFTRACLDLEGYRQGGLNALLRVPGHAASGGPDASRAETELRRCGIAARVESGVAAELAILEPFGETHRARAEVIGRRDAVVAACRGAGFRFVAIGLG